MKLTFRSPFFGGAQPNRIEPLVLRRSATECNGTDVILHLRGAPFSGRVPSRRNSMTVFCISGKYVSDV